MPARLVAPQPLKEAGGARGGSKRGSSQGQTTDPSSKRQRGSAHTEVCEAWSKSKPRGSNLEVLIDHPPGAYASGRRGQRRGRQPQRLPGLRPPLHLADGTAVLGAAPPLLVAVVPLAAVARVRLPQLRVGLVAALPPSVSSSVGASSSSVRSSIDPRLPTELSAPSFLWARRARGRTRGRSRQGRRRWRGKPD